MDNKKPIPKMSIYDVEWVYANDDTSINKKLLREKVLVVEYYSKFEDIRSIIALSAWGNPKLTHRVEIISIRLVPPTDS